MDHVFTYLIFINVVAFAAFAFDKWRAVRGSGRVREAVLLGISLAGGAVGGLVAMYTVHHKTRKWYFRYGLPLMIVLQIAVLLCFQLG